MQSGTVGARRGSCCRPSPCSASCAPASSCPAGSSSATCRLANSPHGGAAAPAPCAPVTASINFFYSTFVNAAWFLGTIAIGTSSRGGVDVGVVDPGGWRRQWHLGHDPQWQRDLRWPRAVAREATAATTARGAETGVARKVRCARRRVGADLGDRGVRARPPVTGTLSDAAAGSDGDDIDDQCE
jgi:hypothetical protein